MKKLFAIVAGSAFLFSCQEEVELQLKSSDPVYIIEANIVAGDTNHTVRISQSVNFSEANSFPSVIGAVVP